MYHFEKKNFSPANKKSLATIVGAVVHPDRRNSFQLGPVNLTSHPEIVRLAYFR